MTEPDFRRASDEALEILNRQLSVVAENHDAEVMFQNGVLTIEVEEPNPGKIVISPNTPVRQIWISALSRSFKLDWSGTEFVYAQTGEGLGRCHLVDEVKVDEQECGRAGLLGNNVRVPDFFEECPWMRIHCPSACLIRRDMRIGAHEHP